MSIELVVLFFYFVFLLGLIYGANNMNHIANHPRTEEFINKITYNFRELPRVNYKEDSSEEESSEDDGYSSPSDDTPEQTEDTAQQTENPEIVTQALKRRRDINAFSRIIEETLG